jgi:hypothetical protein
MPNFSRSSGISYGTRVVLLIDMVLKVRVCTETTDGEILGWLVFLFT